MKINKQHLLLTALLLLPFYTLVAALYAASFIPAGTFRPEEKAHQVALVAIKNESLIKAGAPATVEPAPQMITGVNSNGTVRVNVYA